MKILLLKTNCLYQKYIIGYRGVVSHGCTGAYAPAEILVHPSSERPFTFVHPSSERPYHLCTRPVKILTTLLDAICFIGKGSKLVFQRISSFWCLSILFKNLNNYFNGHVCPSIRPFVSSSQNFFSLKSPWNHPLTPGVEPRGWPWVPPGHAAPPEKLARARRALSSSFKCEKSAGCEV